MADDFITMDTAALQKQFAEIEKKLTTIDRDLRSGIMRNVTYEAAVMLKNEQARILGTAPSENVRSLAADLSVWEDRRKHSADKASFRAGYSGDKINQSIKYFIIEYGRPGKKGRAKDSLGRRIGRVVPFPHIRSAWFLKRDAINKYIAERVEAEILERWNK